MPTFLHTPSILLLLPFLLLILIRITTTLRTALKPGLRHLPGPLLARFTRLYRISLVWRGDCPTNYLALHRQYGPIVRTGPNHVSISSPAAIPTIYGINTRFIKSEFYAPMAPVYEGATMDSLFTLRTPAANAKLKRPVAALFSMSSIRAFEPAAEACTKIFLEAMKDLEQKGEIVDFGAWLQWYAFDVIGAITFNRRFGFMEQRCDYKGLIHGLEGGLVYAGIVGQVPEWHGWLLGSERFMRVVKAVLGEGRVPDPIRTIMEFTQQCIDDYDQNKGNREYEVNLDSEGNNNDAPDFLTWLRREDQKGKGTMPYRDLMNHLSNNLIAGSDTTAISLRAVFYYLIKTPSAYQKLQAEIDAADNEGRLSPYVSYAESLGLPYLQAVLKEATRCHPGVSFPLERIVPPATESTPSSREICGTILPPGTIVGINPVVMHHDTSIFGEDAATFRPERWLESEGADPEQLRRMERCLLTFGHGSRSCIGKNISIMEMGKFVPQVLREFDIYWTHPDGKEEWSVGNYWFARQGDFWVRFVSRRRGD